MARQENLTVIKGGLNRQRTKGAALKDSLYDLLNGYVTTEKTVRVRPGTLLRQTLTTGTKGLVHHDGKFQVFASDDVSGLPTDYNLNIVRSPTGSALSRIHFAEPFLGSLYVVAEFADGNVYHYWLQPSTTWVANNEYKLSSAVNPTTANNYRYIPTRNGQPFPTWTPGAARAVGDKIEPTQFNGYYFEAVTINGSNPRSGVTEPNWVNDANIVAGKRYVESVDGTYQAPRPTPPRDRDRRPPPGRDIEDRYGRGRWRRNERRYNIP